MKSTIRYKKVNGKRVPLCDYQGKCKNKAYMEVYPFAIKNSEKKGWSYLCRKHYYEEQKRFNGKLPACLKVEW